MLADNASPRVIQDHMKSYLDPTIRYDIDRQLKGRPSDKSAETPAKGQAKPTGAAA